MEQEYRALQEANMVKDFKICMIFLTVFSIIASGFASSNRNWPEVYANIATIVVFPILFCLQRYFTKYIQVITLIIFLGYGLSRIVLVKYYINVRIRNRLYFAGYILANLQNVLFLQLHKVSHKAIGIITILIFRFLIFSLYIEPGSFSEDAFIRHFLVDFYIIYTHYTHEVHFRKIYQDFVQKREELLKFKELLSDSLPQSLLVVTQMSNKFLFYNKTFQHTFGNPKNQEVKAKSENPIKSILESLHVEQSSIREAGTNNIPLNLLADMPYPLSLAEALEKLSADDVLNNRTILLTASFTKETNRRLFEVTLKKVKWDNEDAIAVLFNDITYQENLISLKLANINKDKVIATVSHELRTPLNGIIGILDIAEKKVENPEVTKYLSLCKDNAQLLMSLVNSILDLQQISTGKLKLNYISVDIRKVIDSIAQLFYFQCNEKSISLKYDVHTDVSKSIITDENRLKQVLINLVGNAIKFTSKGGVVIEVSPSQNDHDNLYISVKDTGIGIKHEDQKHLFKMYSKLQSGESVNKNGVGLGLTISNALAALLNSGRDSRGIEVESEYGVGTKFYFDIAKNLPERKQMQAIKSEFTKEGKITRKREFSRLDTEATKMPLLLKSTRTEDEELEDEQQNYCNEFFAPSDLHSKIAQHSFNGKTRAPGVLKNTDKDSEKPTSLCQDSLDIAQIRLKTENPEETIPEKSLHDLQILIIDDNPFNLLVARNLIQELGCKITTCLGGQEAIETVKNSFSKEVVFNVIFMDCQMPIMDGFEATKALKELMEADQIPKTPIYGWTANNSEEDVTRCYEAGMEGHLPKPASKSDFLKILSKL